jgi:CheY-like chemotaxis protein
MPAMGGAAVVARLRTVFGRIPVIIMSGLPPALESPEVVRLGVQGIIGKPFKAEELLTLIRDVLDAR